MTILLDENLDWRLGRDLVGRHTSSVPLIGWAGTKNGELLRRANVQFDVLITMEKGIYHQQNLAGMRLTIVALRAKDQSPRGYPSLIPAVLKLLENAGPGEFHSIA